MNATSEKTQTTRVSAGRLREFAKEAFLRAGVEAAVAEETSRALWLTSLRGVDSHGMRLLPHYVTSIQSGRLNPKPVFKFEQTSASTGRLDADHSLGHAAGMEAMRHAIRLARKAGMGFVSVRNSSHCGAMATYALEACERDMIGLAYTHATARLKTPNAPRPFLGTNPICFAAPMANEGPFCFDAAPTTFSFNKVRQYGELGKTLPRDVAADKDGNVTLNPSFADQLLPIGDYKGFGLSLMVEILCGLLAGMPVGRDVSSMFGASLSEKRYLGQFYGAMRIDVFEDVKRFKSRLQELVDNLRSEARQDPSIPIQVAGDPEKAAQREREQDGIPLYASELASLNALAVRLGMEPLP
jgi:LDH2 family malate/lactate/ureidoglycolate dehydrogenase